MSDKKLVLSLPPNWREASAELEVDIPTFIRDDSKASGALQVSTAWYRGGAPPKPGAADLIDFAKSLIASQAGVTDIQDGYVADCKIGRFGSVIAQVAESRMQVWCASNGYDFVITTHTSIGEPESAELEEAESIVRTMTIKESDSAKPWWKVW